jgi:hypothetical protein
MCPRSDSDDQTRSVNLSGIIGSIGGDIVGRDKITLNLGIEIRDRIKDFSSSAEYMEMMARAPESDPDMRLSTPAVLIIQAGSFLIVAVATLTLIWALWRSGDFQSWFPPDEGLLPVKFRQLIGPTLIAWGVFALIFGAARLLKAISYKSDLHKLNKLAVGVIEKTFVITNPGQGHFELICLTGDNDRKGFILPKEFSHTISIGDVGIVLFITEQVSALAQVSAFWRSKTFSR